MRSDGVSTMRCQLLKQQLAPDTDIDIFSGNPMDFHYFMGVFMEIVDKKECDTRQKLMQLIKDKLKAFDNFKSKQQNCMK